MHSVSSLCRLCGEWFKNVEDLNAHKLEAHKKPKSGDRSGFEKRQFSSTRYAKKCKFVCNRGGCRDIFDTHEEREEHRLIVKHK